MSGDAITGVSISLWRADQEPVFERRRLRARSALFCRDHAGTCIAIHLVMRSVFAALIASSVLLASPFAFAADDAIPAPPLPPSTHWYGYETLAVDAAALALVLPIAMSHDNNLQEGLFIASGAIYGHGGPIVHFAHGHVSKGFTDLGLRTGLPVAFGFVGGLIGAAGGPNNSLGPTFLGVLVGGAIGMGSAIAFDAAWLAREPAPGHLDARVDVRPAPRTTSDSSAAHFEPTFGVSPERQGGARGVLGLRGTF
jgi:hypothetical protein